MSQPGHLMKPQHRRGKWSFNPTEIIFLVEKKPPTIPTWLPYGMVLPIMAGENDMVFDQSWLVCGTAPPVMQKGFSHMKGF